ncbi:hypothetical protein IAE40_04925 [Pseudomonas sp. S44]|uniref:hypothetical protein n=1 Tax=Pseudomonas sp. S44 TaxID=2767450 RepID=UPI00190D3696|nr:hypothetical protein [Pseudomonas sp. S44]MBK0057966.1 hypothetical protein [Pseudomonas sp. S44]
MNKLVMKFTVYWIHWLFHALRLFPSVSEHQQKQAFAQRPTAQRFGMPFAQHLHAGCA